MQKQNVKTLSLIVCTFTYLLVGAAIFDALESAKEAEEKLEQQARINEFKTKHGINDSAFENISNQILFSKPYNAGIQWKFAGAFYFALTVITTIGYGFSTPRTYGGKIFCLVYALIGIPINLVMFQSIGERLNTFITFVLKNIKKCLKMKKTDVSQTNLIIVVLHLCMIVLFTGAAAFNHFEKWDFLTALYYCYITVTTIGFGDFVALQADGMLQSKPHYVAFSLIFILIGLAIFAAATNLLVLRFMTMNGDETERKEEIENILNATHMSETDIIPANTHVTHQANGNVSKGYGDHNSVHENHKLLMPEYDDIDQHSVCSCSCYSLRGRTSKTKHYTATRPPGNIDHLLPNNTGYNSTPVHIIQRDEDCHSEEEFNVMMDQLQQKRASV